MFTERGKTFTRFQCGCGSFPNKVSLIFEKVSETNVMQIINNLPNKNSCGFDGISMIVMKSIKHVTYFTNQSNYQYRSIPK